MPWYAYALGSAFLFGILDLLQKILAVKSHDPRVFSVVFNFWGAGFAIIAFMLQGGSFAALRTISLTQYLLIGLAAIMYGIFERYHFEARKGLDASMFAILFRLSTVIAFIGSITLFGESVTAVKVTGTMCIIGASLLLVFKNPKLKLNRAFILGLLCSISLGLAFTIDKPASSQIPASLYSFLVWCLPIGIIAYPSVKLKDLQREFFIGSWKVAVTALINVVGYILYIQAFALAEASRVVPVVSIDGIITVLGGVIILKEHDHLWRKLIAMALAFTGVYLLR